MATVPGNVRLSRHVGDLDDDGHEDILSSVTTETDTTLRLAPDGAGGVEWGAGSGSSFGSGGFDVTPPLSIALPPWVKPSGSGVITNDAQGRLTILNDTAYKAFPGMTYLEGRLHLVYRSGASHSSVDGIIKYKYSDDLGRTWSTATSIATPGGSRDLRDPSIVALSSGRLLVGYDDCDGSGIPLYVSVIYSDNRGQSWSSEYQVPVTGMSGECAGTSQPIELPDGSILIPAFGDNGGNSFCVVFKSTDGGATFPTQITVASSGSRHYQELQIRLLASGKIVGLMRSDTNVHTWRTVSTDGGATWSSPTDVLTASARPDFVEFFPGALLFFGRTDNTNFYARWAVSWDEGATWTALQSVDGSTDVWEYGAPVVLAPGYVAVAYSLQNSSSDADLYMRYYHDGYGIDPLGNLTILSGAGAPTTADYLVGTANGSLSAEIVVGTTPGGDLGGTWASPAVEAIQGVAVTDAGTTGDVLTKTGAATATWETPAASGSSGGMILITDVPAGSPLIFADLLQNDAGTDLLYADA